MLKLKELYKKTANREKNEVGETSYDYDELMNLSFKLLLNTDYYEKINNIWVDKTEDEEYLKNKLSSAEEIKIVGIVKPSDEWTGAENSTGGILYTKELEEYVINKINEAEIVKEQKAKDKLFEITKQ